MSPSGAGSGTPFALVVPVKTLTRAKSRLTGYPDDVRRALATAFALDALAAATSGPAVGSVAVVTDEPDVAGLVRDIGCDVLPDEGAGDLNRALQRAVLALGPSGPGAAMLGDLPCLLPEDLEQALGSVQDKGFVADAEGTGTTLVAVRDPASFVTHFGAGSRAGHVAAGIEEITLELTSLRRDVDTADDLAAARMLGVGPRTGAVLARI
jgi:2-phospho-L-lactate guanylyltransferase